LQLPHFPHPPQSELEEEEDLASTISILGCAIEQPLDDELHELSLNVHVSVQVMVLVELSVHLDLHVEHVPVDPEQLQDELSSHIFLAITILRLSFVIFNNLVYNSV